MCLAGCTRSDVSMVVHQAATFSNDQKACHDVAVKRIRKHPLGTSEEGLAHKLCSAKGMEVHVDADFYSGFEKNNSEDPASI